MLYRALLRVQGLSSLGSTAITGAIEAWQVDAFVSLNSVCSWSSGISCRVLETGGSFNLDPSNEKRCMPSSSGHRRRRCAHLRISSETIRSLPGRTPIMIGQVYRTRRLGIEVVSIHTSATGSSPFRNSMSINTCLVCLKPSGQPPNGMDMQDLHGRS